MYKRQDKLSKGEQPQCALACPLRALDFGPIEELEAKYGAARSLEGMPDTSVLRPAMVFKPLGTVSYTHLDVYKRQ